MFKKIGRKEIQSMNLFEKITKVRPNHYFTYNNISIFSVPRHLISRAIGEGGKNIKKMSAKMGERVKVVSIPKDINKDNAKNFFEVIVSPAEIKDIEVNEDEIILHGGRSKAALIGRNKRRLVELQKISKDFFGKNLKVV